MIRNLVRITITPFSKMYSSIVIFLFRHCDNHSTNSIYVSILSLGYVISVLDHPGEGKL